MMSSNALDQQEISVQENVNKPQRVDFLNQQRISVNQFVSNDNYQLFSQKEYIPFQFQNYNQSSQILDVFSFQERFDQEKITNNLEDIPLARLLDPTIHSFEPPILPIQKDCMLNLSFFLNTNNSKEMLWAVGAFYTFTKQQSKLIRVSSNFYFSPDSKTCYSYQQHVSNLNDLYLVVVFEKVLQETPFGPIDQQQVGGHQSLRDDLLFPYLSSSLQDIDQQIRQQQAISQLEYARAPYLVAIQPFKVIDLLRQQQRDQQQNQLLIQPSNKFRLNLTQYFKFSDLSKDLNFQMALEQIMVNSFFSDNSFFQQEELQENIFFEICILNNGVVNESNQILLLNELCFNDVHYEYSGFKRKASYSQQELQQWWNEILSADNFLKQHSIYLENKLDRKTVEVVSSITAIPLNMFYFLYTMISSGFKIEDVQISDIDIHNIFQKADYCQELININSDQPFSKYQNIVYIQLSELKLDDKLPKGFDQFALVCEQKFLFGSALFLQRNNPGQSCKSHCSQVFNVHNANLQYYDLILNIPNLCEKNVLSFKIIGIRASFSRLTQTKKMFMRSFDYDWRTQGDSVNEISTNFSIEYQLLNQFCCCGTDLSEFEQHSFQQEDKVFKSSLIFHVLSLSSFICDNRKISELMLTLVKLSYIENTVSKYVLNSLIAVIKNSKNIISGFPNDRFIQRNRYYIAQLVINSIFKLLLVVDNMQSFDLGDLYNSVQIMLYTIFYLVTKTSGTNYLFDQLIIFQVRDDFLQKLLNQQSSISSIVSACSNNNQEMHNSISLLRDAILCDENEQIKVGQEHDSQKNNHLHLLLDWALLNNRSIIHDLDLFTNEQEVQSNGKSYENKIYLNNQQLGCCKTNGYLLKQFFVSFSIHKPEPKDILILIKQLYKMGSQSSYFSLEKNISDNYMVLFELESFLLNANIQELRKIVKIIEFDDYASFLAQLSKQMNKWQITSNIDLVTSYVIDSFMNYLFVFGYDNEYILDNTNLIFGQIKCFFSSIQSDVIVTYLFHNCQFRFKYYYSKGFKVSIFAQLLLLLLPFYKGNFCFVQSIVQLIQLNNQNFCWNQLYSVLFQYNLKQIISVTLCYEQLLKKQKGFQDDDLKQTTLQQQYYDSYVLQIQFMILENLLYFDYLLAVDQKQNIQQFYEQNTYNKLVILKSLSYSQDLVSNQKINFIIMEQFQKVEQYHKDFLTVENGLDYDKAIFNFQQYFITFWYQFKITLLESSHQIQKFSLFSLLASGQAIKHEQVNQKLQELKLQLSKRRSESFLNTSINKLYQQQKINSLELSEQSISEIQIAGYYIPIKQTLKYSDLICQIYQKFFTNFSKKILLETNSFYQQVYQNDVIVVINSVKDLELVRGILSLLSKLFEDTMEQLDKENFMLYFHFFHQFIIQMLLTGFGDNKVRSSTIKIFNTICSTLRIKTFDSLQKQIGNMFEKYVHQLVDINNNNEDQLLKMKQQLDYAYDFLNIKNNLDMSKITRSRIFNYQKIIRNRLETIGSCVDFALQIELDINLLHQHNIDFEKKYLKCQQLIKFYNDHPVYLIQQSQCYVLQLFLLLNSLFVLVNFRNKTMLSQEDQFSQNIFQYFKLLQPSLMNLTVISNDCLLIFDCRNENSSQDQFFSCLEKHLVKLFSCFKAVKALYQQLGYFNFQNVIILMKDDVILYINQLFGCTPLLKFYNLKQIDIIQQFQYTVPPTDDYYFIYMNLDKDFLGNRTPYIYSSPYQNYDVQSDNFQQYIKNAYQKKLDDSTTGATSDNHASGSVHTQSKQEISSSTNNQSIANETTEVIVQKVDNLQFSMKSFSQQQQLNTITMLKVEPYQLFNHDSQICDSQMNLSTLVSEQLFIQVASRQHYIAARLLEFTTNVFFSATQVQIIHDHEHQLSIFNEGLRMQFYVTAQFLPSVRLRSQILRSFTVVLFPLFKLTREFQQLSKQLSDSLKQLSDASDKQNVLKNAVDSLFQFFQRFKEGDLVILQCLLEGRLPPSYEELFTKIYKSSCFEPSEQQNQSQLALKALQCLQSREYQLLQLKRVFVDLKVTFQRTMGSVHKGQLDIDSETLLSVNKSYLNFTEIFNSIQL